jgi:hypothetical protein
MTVRKIMKVVDSNLLRCPRLGKYLAEAPQNCAVLTEYAAIEAYKAETLDTLYRSMKILSQFPKQVIVLKPTQVVFGLSGRCAGLQRRLIDPKQTTGFARFCAYIREAERGNRFVEMQLLDYARAARLEMERLLPDLDEFRAGVEALTKEFTAHELKILSRGDGPFSENMRIKIMGHVVVYAKSLLDRHPRVTKMPHPAEFPNTFIFRYALCRYLLGLTVISQGGLQQKNPVRLRNDLVDMTFVAYATYFDGILSNEKKVNGIYAGAMFLLKHVFVSRL